MKTHAPLFVLIAAGVLLGPPSAGAKEGPPALAAIEAAVDSPDRPEADRKLQQNAVMKLYQQIGKLGYVGGATIDLRDQARARAKPLKDDDPLKKELEAYAAELDKLNAKIAAQRESSGITGEEQIRERAGELYGQLSRFGGRPTQSQIDTLAVVEKEIDDAAATFEKLSADKAVAAAGLKKLSREDWEKRQR